MLHNKACVFTVAERGLYLVSFFLLAICFYPRLLSWRRRCRQTVWSTWRRPSKAPSKERTVKWFRSSRPWPLECPVGFQTELKLLTAAPSDTSQRRTSNPVWELFLFVCFCCYFQFSEDTDKNDRKVLFPVFSFFLPFPNKPDAEWCEGSWDSRRLWFFSKNPLTSLLWFSSRAKTQTQNNQKTKWDLCLSRKRMLLLQTCPPTPHSPWSNTRAHNLFTSALQQ